MDSRLLVAAHIKKRSYCTDEEKRDLSNIGMLNCKFGCDELYERGFISVSDDWTVIVKTSIKDLAAHEYIDERLQNSIVPRPSSSKYFAWHRKHHNF